MPMDASEIEQRMATMAERARARRTEAPPEPEPEPTPNLRSLTSDTIAPNLTQSPRE